MNIFSCASARIYPSILLLTSALAISCAEAEIYDPSLEPTPLEICTRHFNEFIAMVPWLAGSAEMNFVEAENSELDANVGVILLPFLGYGGAEYNVDGGYTCSVSVDHEGLNTCQTNFVAGFSRIETLAQFDDAVEELTLCHERARCHEQAAEDFTRYIEAGMNEVLAAQMAEESQVLCLCNVEGFESVYCTQID